METDDGFQRATSVIDSKSRPRDVSDIGFDDASVRQQITKREQQLGLDSAHEVGDLTIGDVASTHFFEEVSDICVALGYEDANDADRLRGDAMVRLLVAGGATSDELVPQPALSRFESATTIGGPYRMGATLATKVFDYRRKRLGRRVRKITIDMDPTDTPNYGEQQQLSFYGGQYDNYGSLPMLCFVSFEGEPDQ
ncbi:MAG: transposase [Deltaproteobacteria bacterium]|nr:transposase [Deltaproteobacteria bacterium]